MRDGDREATRYRQVEIDRAARGLETLLRAQAGLQKTSFGIDPTKMTGEKRRQFALEMATAISSEVIEALDEINWKSWSSSTEFNREPYVKELVDALHFILNLMLLAGNGRSLARLGQDYAEAYFNKREVNAKRQERGYDGKLSKCSCSRDIEDGKLLWYGEEVRAGAYQCQCGKVNALND